MTVWLVEEVWGTITVGVFSTRERAEAAAERLRENLRDPDIALVTEWTLDEEEEL